MPLRPDFSQHRPDPRLDLYRDRVGRLYRAEDEVGSVLVLVEPWSMTVGGHLWWRRWGPSRDVLWEHTVVDGNFSDTFVPEDATDEVLAFYDSGRFDYYGEAMRVVWTDALDSWRLRSREFGR